MTAQPARLEDRLPALTVHDEHQLRRRLARARKLRDAAARRARLEEIARAVGEAERRVARRREAVPELSYPEQLPVAARKEAILAALRASQVVIVAGETGSGKSTQLPKLCLELGRGVRGFVGHTQPRRIAARSVAERVAEELGGEVGGVVGYTVRFNDQVGEDTLVKVMTDGILLAEIQRDGLLTRYDTLIIDEAHERSLNIDFILGYLRQLLPRRPDLKVVVTSATIDTERFSQHFDGAPVVEVSGRTYPVEVRYRPFDEDDAERDQVQAVCDAVVELAAEGPGDMLVFLSGEREIRDTADALRRMQLPGTEVLPLYARLSAAEQHRVFAPHGGRRVVLATNVAETSLTVPGIRYVVDAGTARISRYSRRTKVQRLPIEPVSQASADQRAGRCGRVGPGVCVRLYSEEDLLARPAFTEPEILRTNLAAVILQMAALGLGDVARFPFVEAPDARSIRDGILLLEELGALVAGDGEPAARLTAVGRALAQLPLDPRLGRMVLEADRNGCLREVLVIAAALAIQDPRERPASAQQEAAEKHARFADPDSDFFAYLNLWEHLREQQRSLSSSQFRKLCKAEHLNYLRVREWQDVHGQVREIAAGLGMHRNADPGDRNAVHKSLLAGLLSHIGMKDAARQEYVGARNTRFVIAPGSPLAKKGPAWVMAAELVETSRLWARTAARIQPEWAESVGAHLVKRSYGEPRWDAARATVTARERVTLYGMPVVAGRTVDFGRVDPDVARELFIRRALVEGDWQTSHAFFARNRRLVERVRALEDRARRRDILVGDDALFEFYDRRLPAEVTSGRRFDAWWRRRQTSDPQLLDVTADVLLEPGARGVSLEAFPDTWRQDDLELQLSYRYEPGADDDGVTVHLPLAVLNRVTADGFDWHVPGLREELVIALIRALPKQVRRNLVPVAGHARAFLASASPSQGPLLDVLAHELSRRGGERVGRESWDLDLLPPHLRLRYSVEDERGRTLAAGRDLGPLRQSQLGRVRAAVAGASPSLERTGMRDWELEVLPRTVDGYHAGHVVRGYPALVDEGETVGVRVLPSEAEQEHAMWEGTRRLLLLAVPGAARAVERRTSSATRLALAANPYGSVADLLGDCLDAALDELVAGAGGPAWDRAGFARLCETARAELIDAAAAAVSVVGNVLDAARRVERRLASAAPPALQPAHADVRRQLFRLVHAGFVATTGTRRLPNLVRYLDAADRRLEKLPREAERDRERMRRVQALQEVYEEIVRNLPPGGATARLEEVRWMLEELRVSFFAQVLGTAVPVSEQRILRALDEVVAPA